MRWGGVGGFSECGQLLLRSCALRELGFPPTPHPHIVIKGPRLLGVSIHRLSRSHGKEELDKNWPSLPHPCLLGGHALPSHPPAAPPPTPEDR